MDITIHLSFLPHDAFYRDTLGFELRDPAGNLVRIQEVR